MWSADAIYIVDMLLQFVTMQPIDMEKAQDTHQARNPTALTTASLTAPSAASAFGAASLTATTLSTTRTRRATPLVPHAPLTPLSHPHPIPRSRPC